MRRSLATGWSSESLDISQIRPHPGHDSFKQPKPTSVTTRSRSLCLNQRAQKDRCPLQIAASATIPEVHSGEKRRSEDSEPPRMMTTFKREHTFPKKLGVTTVEATELTVEKCRMGAQTGTVNHLGASDPSADSSLQLNQVSSSTRFPSLGVTSQHWSGARGDSAVAPLAARGEAGRGLRVVTSIPDERAFIAQRCRDPLHSPTGGETDGLRQASRTRVSSEGLWGTGSRGRTGHICDCSLRGKHGSAVDRVPLTCRTQVRDMYSGLFIPSVCVCV